MMIIWIHCSLLKIFTEGNLHFHWNSVQLWGVYAMLIMNWKKNQAGGDNIEWLIKSEKD